MSDAANPEMDSTRWQRRPIVYLTILAIALAGVLAKQQFGKFALHLMGKSISGLQTPLQWLMSEWGLLAIAAIACFLHPYSGLPSAPRLTRLMFRDARTGPRPAMWRPGIIAALLCLLIFVASQIYQTFWGAPIPLAAKMGALPHDQMVKLATLYPLALVGAPLSEEVQFRFGLISLLMGAMSVLGLGRRQPNNNVAFWIANIAQAVLFGFVHVQQGLVASQAGGLVFQTAIAPQTYSGIIFGVVFRRWGLEAAIIAHFVADLLTPLFLACWGLAIHHH